MPYALHGTNQSHRAPKSLRTLRLHQYRPADRTAADRASIRRTHDLPVRTRLREHLSRLIISTGMCLGLSTTTRAAALVAFAAIVADQPVSHPVAHPLDMAPGSALA